MLRKNNILVTGGLGYIGSHTVVELLKKNYNVVVIDNLVNSKKNIIKKINKIINKKFYFHKIDIRSKTLEKIFKKYKIDCVIHFAALKSTRESESKYEEYLDNNIYGSLNLINIMRRYNCKKIIFSSSACVYDEKNKLPIKENGKINPKSVYGFTKEIIERSLRLFSSIDDRWSIVILRYFNPIGCHSSGLIPEDPSKAENIVPKIVNVIKNKENFFRIFGNNYPTSDGTCYRDYIHVQDLVDAHIKSIKLTKKKIFEIINIGTGRAYSVKEILTEFSRSIGYQINSKISKRRPGDVPVCYANSNKAKKILNWQPKYNLERMCTDVINSLKENK